MRVALLIAVILATDVLKEASSWRRRSTFRRRRSLDKKEEKAAGEVFEHQVKLELLQDAVATLEEAVDELEAREIASPDLGMGELQEMERAFGNLDEGDTFDTPEKRDEVEEDAALGLIKEELEELVEELRGVNIDGTE
ncbi:PREDICTED: uncharacterized protein LOC109463864 [Branchiostoma belcheri]|uniref:Uncharacterized protein LOC109463864 n=1 Tax=Branchiostoma belcheri TaxID=7741 RepID=A0A6P4XID0_BRABE|nr:PREDICTED: uncharacterized protein LOC109463864 [Branchiostoma belcheri]